MPRYSRAKRDVHAEGCPRFAIGETARLVYPFAIDRPHCYVAVRQIEVQGTVFVRYYGERVRFVWDGDHLVGSVAMNGTSYTVRLEKADV
jgi:hypothetical protein